MQEYGFSLARILPYKDRIVDSVFIRENIRTESWILTLHGRIWVSKNPYSRIFYAVCHSMAVDKFSYKCVENQYKKVGLLLVF